MIDSDVASCVYSLPLSLAAWQVLTKCLLDE